MDTQGLNDNKTSTAVNVKVFALSTMLSSIQIYNLKQQIQENDLQLLKVQDHGFAISFFFLVQELESLSTYLCCVIEVLHGLRATSFET
jgi:hypothetical protein